MTFDGQCPQEPSGLEVPTLEPSKDADPCDRTDYSLVEDLTDSVGTSTRLQEEIINHYAELEEVNEKFNLGQTPSELHELSIVDPQMAYDYHQYKIASPGIFRVETRNGPSSTERTLGTGFAARQVGDRCQVVTDYHVVTKNDGNLEPMLSLRARNGNLSFAKVEKLEDTTDLALLSVPVKAIGSCNVLPLADTSLDLRPGEDRITTIGHPSGSKNQFISGGELLRMGRKHTEISNHPDAQSKPWKDNEVGEVKAHVIGGNSGGPALANGEVVGATQYRRGNYEMFFTPVEDIHELLNGEKPLEPNVPREMHCKKAEEEIQSRTEAGQRTSTSYSGSGSLINSTYIFSDGVEITVTKNGKEKNCQKILVNPLIS